MSAISIKSKEEIEIMRVGGRILASVLQKVSQAVKAGTSAADLDKLARELIFSSGGRPSFLNYKPGGSGEGYPAALCVSVNDEIVHGLPLEDKIISEGDLVKLDLRRGIQKTAHGCDSDGGSEKNFSAGGKNHARHKRMP